MDPSAPAVDPWKPGVPRLHLVRLLLAWIASAFALLLATWIVPGADVRGFGGAVLAAAAIAVLNVVLPPIIAALRLPYMVAAGFLLVLALDAVMLLVVSDAFPDQLHVKGFWEALAVSLLTSAFTTAISVVVGLDDDTYTLRVARRVARRVGPPIETDQPGLICLEIDGLGLPVLRRAIASGHAPTLGRWLAEGDHRVVEWETDLSSQTGASQAGILFGDNHEIPAFRWVDKATGQVMTCSSPDDCAALEKKHSGPHDLLLHGGTSRGNLLSGGAETAILTVSRIADEKKANPGYRAFLANGTNVTRTFVLFLWEIGLELVAATRQRRRDVVPRGHRGGIYPLLRGGMCVFVRDIVIFSVLQDLFRGVPTVYATFASYDEVAHHSGLERPDTLEALRKLDQRFSVIEDALRFAPRPYHLVVLSDHGQTQGATFLQRNGYGLDELVERSMRDGRVQAVMGGDENETGTQRALDEATGRQEHTSEREEGGDAQGNAVVLGSGNLGLVYLMEQDHRMTREEIDRAHPDLLPALAGHEHVGFVMVRSEADGAVAIGARGTHRLRDGVVEGEDPLAPFSPRAAQHLLRTDGFGNAPDILVNSFYDPVADEGCAFEELISFHGGMGGAQTEPFLLYPVELPAPAEPIVGAAAVNAVLRGWRDGLGGGPVPAPAPTPDRQAAEAA